MKRWLVSAVCAMAAALAVSSMAGACILYTYQPKVPQKLLNR